jgi:diguanylate cyclase (GGDEF)-like protein
MSTSIHSRAVRDRVGGALARFPQPYPADEHLVEESRQRAARPLLARDRPVSLVLGGAFLATAFTLATAIPASRPAPPLLVATLILSYALVSRIEFEIGSGSAVPTQIVLVPMLLLLPPSLAPLCVAAGYVLGAGVDYARGAAHAERTFVLLSSSWHAVGPALVLAFFAPNEPAWTAWPIYLAALGAQFVFDFVSSSAREWLAFGVPPREMARFLTWVFSVDALLAPVGLLAAFAAAERTFAFALVLPLAFLFGILARERRARIDQALAFDHAYQGATREARRDALTGLGNRLAWEEGVDRAEATFAHSRVPTSVILLDIDGLKTANDTRGHEFGDELLCAVARLVAASVRQRDLVARIGGDELAVLLLEADERTCFEMVSRLELAFARHPGLDGFRLSAALGYGSCPPARSVAEALRAADVCMYESKRDSLRRSVARLQALSR